MSSRRVFRLFLVVVVLVLALAPTLALANGPSAGDNQYTDPLAGSTTSHSTPPPKTTSSPPAATSTPPAPSTAAPPVSPSTPTVTPSTGTTPDPSGATSSSAPSAGTLPLTGFDAWVGAALGAVMLSIGIVLRRRLATR